MSLFLRTRPVCWCQVADLHVRASGLHRAPGTSWPQGGIYHATSDWPVLWNLTEGFMGACWHSLRVPRHMILTVSCTDLLTLTHVSMDQDEAHVTGGC